MFAYEKLEVYKKAFAVNQNIYRFLKANNSIPRYVKDQLGRATLSIMLNIAEGSGKFSNKDRRSFYVIARGSAFECSSILSFLFNESEIPEALYTELINVYEEVSRMLYAMIQNLNKEQ